MNKEDMIDISLLETSNKSILKSIEYCNSRNIKVEIVKNVKDACGKYICQIDDETFYEDYYLQIQYIALEHSNKVCNSFRYRSIIVYDKPYEEFYIAENNTINFYRRDKGPHKDKFQSPSGTVYDEFDYIPGCTLQLLKGIKDRQLDESVISDSKLNEYHRYFISILEPVVPKPVLMDLDSESVNLSNIQKLRPPPIDVSYDSTSEDF